jgi:hypothetical protein
LIESAIRPSGKHGEAPFYVIFFQVQRIFGAPLVTPFAITGIDIYMRAALKLHGKLGKSVLDLWLWL